MSTPVEQTTTLRRAELEGLHEAFNDRSLVHPDPIEVLYDYPDPADREIVALIAACLSYGGVKQILRSVREALERIGPPAQFVRDGRLADFEAVFDVFVHRVARGHHVAALLAGIRDIVTRHGSLLNGFLCGLRDEHETVLPALQHFVSSLNVEEQGRCGHLLADPARGSACKRLHLFLRWLVRQDAVDVGDWSQVGAHRLIMPVDTHVHRVCSELGLTQRKQANLRTALEITDAFRHYAPDDPVKYDFALTRIGMRGDASLADYFTCLSETKGAHDD